ncbi:MAG TPA: signal peptide peptidase SppA [Candidatus Acidoferrum sp.]|nr:signal peptide peptidase SppA [Candidatus Acidoferrum sp.]
MSVMRFIRRLIYGLCAIVGAVVVLVAVVSLITVWFFPEARHPVPDRAVLTLDLADGLSERGPSGPLAWASFGRGLTIRDLVQGLDAAGRDDRVKGLVARIGAGELGMARAQEIRDAVLAFRQHGKFAVAFAETFGEVGEGNTHYYLATAFDEIWLQPSGEVGLNGVRLESPYFKPALDAMGVVTRIDQREEYKGAFDPLTSASMPQPVRENYQRLVDSWVQQIAEGIAQGRKLDPAAARALIDRGPFLADEAVKEKLVDKLGYWDDVQEDIDGRASAGPEKAGDKTERMKLADYAADLRPPANAARIALVYGLGPVQLTAHKANPLFGDATMDSDTVARAIRDAAADATVRAIVFRVDSPGGSYVASDTIWHAVERARAGGKPVIVTMGDVAASGGYFVAAPATKIVAQPGTITGSIGVISGKVVLTDMWAKLNVAWDGVQAGANADMDSVNHDYSPAAWSRLETALDHVYADFMTKVGTGRRMTADAVHGVAKGQVWSGADGHGNGLVDELGGYMTALKLARAEAKIPDDQALDLVEFPQVDRSLTGLLARLAEGDSSEDSVRLAHLVKVLEPVARVLAPVIEGPATNSLRAPLLQRSP